MGRGDIDQVLAGAIRKRCRRHASIAAAAAVLAVASTLAVRVELSGVPLVGAFGVVVSVLEFVFITAILPLVVTVVFYGASAISLRRLRGKRVDLPEARLRRLI